MTRRRRWTRRTVAAGLLVGGGLLARAALFRPEAIPVRVARVERGTVERTVANSRAGTVRARRRAKLSPELGGRVAAVPFREGDPVERGAVVLRLDDRQQRAELALREKELAAARAQATRACLAAELAARELERIRSLAEADVASADRLDRARTDAEASRAECAAAQASVERAAAAVALARTIVEKMVLTAPFDGVVAEIDTEIGEWVSPSPPALPIPPIIDILDPASIYVTAPMDEVDAAVLEVGQPARVRIDSYPDVAFAGRVRRVAPYVLDVEAQNRTVEIEVDLDDANRAGRLLPGTSADVEVILEVRRDVVRVPTSALLEGDRLYVVDEGRIVERTVETGLGNWEYTEIVRGVEAGETIVTSIDRSEVRPGALVRIEEGPGAAS